MLHISKSLAYRLLHNGEIVSVRVGRVHRIPKLCIIDYLTKASQ
ncbi:MAG TPA: helix-turn-helix domain-containing protein [Clostridiales bacterium]|nr:helix-turn-helix domain-containing protein [Clostridiales bacterium]